MQQPSSLRRGIQLLRCCGPNTPSLFVDSWLSLPILRNSWLRYVVKSNSSPTAPLTTPPPIRLNIPRTVVVLVEGIEVRGIREYDTHQGLY